MKVSFQRTRRDDFYIHYFIVVLAYVVISRNFHLKLISLRLPSKNKLSLKFYSACIKSFLNKLNTPKVMVPMYLKQMFLLSCHFWKVLPFKFNTSFKKMLQQIDVL